MSVGPRSADLPERVAQRTAPWAGRVGVVVIAYHSDGLVPGLLAEFPKAASIVVVDNSPEATLGERLAVEHPGVIYRHFPENLGFGSAANAGAGLLGTDYILILNPDAEVNLDAIATAVATMDRDGRIAAMGEEKPFRVWRVTLGTYITGAFLLVRRSAFDDVGGFDDDFFLYFEDTDLCARLTRRGFRLAHIPGLAKHTDGRSVRQENDSASERTWIFGASARFFCEKHRLSPAGLWARSFILKQWRREDLSDWSRVFMKGYRDARGQRPAWLRQNLFTTGVRRA